MRRGAGRDRSESGFSARDRTDLAESESRMAPLKVPAVYRLLLGVWLMGMVVVLRGASPERFFRVTVVDGKTGRGVPLVELKTVNHISYWTDSQGEAVIDEPGLMGQEVYLHVSSPGYEVPKDGFGYRGKALRLAPGGRAKLSVNRTQIAERLYRTTGEGIYRDSVLLGLPVPTRHPVLNGSVLGQDTVLAAVFEGKVRWFWGDTDLAHYPLGNFGVSGATSEVPGHDGGLDPAKGLDLDYFVDARGRSRSMCDWGNEGPKWLEGLMLVPGPDGRTRMVARYTRIRDLGYAHEWGLAAWNEQKKGFESVCTVPFHGGHASAHPFLAEDFGRAYWYVFPTLRVENRWETVTNMSAYESFTPLERAWTDTNLPPALERDARGRVVYRWRAGVAPYRPDPQRMLIERRALPATANWHEMVDITTGLPSGASPVRGSVVWNAWRKRWITLASGAPGTVWYAESDLPTGPWVYSRQVAEHDPFNFYNPTQHSFFDADGGRTVFFEGTYTTAFSAAATPTPRYNYNQILYRLSLDDPRLELPVAVYRVAGERDAGVGGESLMLGEDVTASGRWESVRGVAFFALRPGTKTPGTVMIGEAKKGVPGQDGRGDGGSSGDLGVLNEKHGKADGGSRGLFSGMAFRAPDADDIGGRWECVATLPDKSDMAFEMELMADPGGGLRQARFVAEGMMQTTELRRATYSGGKFVAEVFRDAAFFDMTGTNVSGGLVGVWNKRGGTEGGSWKGEKRGAARGDPSTQMVPLTRYRERSTGRLEWDVASPGDGWEAASAPLCLVWKNPIPNAPLSSGVRALVSGVTGSAGGSGAQH